MNELENPLNYKNNNQTDSGQIDCQVILAACPCGKTPKQLHISEGNTCKYAYVYGDCCGEWNIEFRTNYYKLDSIEIKVLAADAWNSASRSTYLQRTRYERD